jgi:hypothetical protein
VKTIEEYAIDLAAGAIEGIAEDDLNEDGEVADQDHPAACDLAIAIARAVAAYPAEVLEQRVRAETAAEHAVERRLLGFARMVLDRQAEYANLHPVDRDHLAAEAADVAQRIVDEIGHPVTDEPALGPSYREQITQLTANLAAMTSRAESAEAMYDQARAQLAQMTAGRATWKAKALEMERARDLAEVDRDTLAAIRAHDGTGPETGPSATHSPEQATVEGQDPDGPQDSSGGRT